MWASVSSVILLTALSAAEEVKIGGVEYISFFTIVDGNCKGNVLGGAIYNTMPEDCAKLCFALEKCAGFTYNQELETCFLKTTTCKNHIQSMWTFWNKNETAIREALKSRILTAAVSVTAKTGAPAQAIGDTSGNILTTMKSTTTGQEIFAGPLAQETAVIMEGQAAIPAVTNNRVDCAAQGTSSGLLYILLFMRNFNARTLGDRVMSEVFVTTPIENANVKFEVISPLLPDQFPRQVLTTNGTFVKSFEVSNSYALQKPERSSKTLLIRSLDGKSPLVVFGVNKERYTSDGFLALPVNKLSTEYYIVCWAPGNEGAEFAVAAVEPNTEITITFAGVGQSITPNSETARPLSVEFEGSTYTNGDTMTLTLEQYESALFINRELNSDLTGTRVLSTKPVAVWSGNIRTSVKFNKVNPSRDHLVEQLAPTVTWGNTFILASTPNRTVGDFYKVMASMDNTEVILNNNITYNLNAGQFVTFELPSHYCSNVISSKPLQVILFVLSQDGTGSAEKADPSMVLIPSIDQYHNSFTFATTDYTGDVGGHYNNFVTLMYESKNADLIVVTSGTKNVTITSRSAGASFLPSTNPDYVCIHYELESGRHTLKTLQRKPAMGLLYGAGDRESYGFPIGMKLELEEECQRCEASRSCDTWDNDCDGKIDEELCDGLDNDGDGEVDEDCCGEPATTTSATPIENSCIDTHTSQTCHGDRAQLKCGDNTVIKVISAHFGRIGWQNEFSCRSPNFFDASGGNVACGFTDIYHEVAERCESLEACSFLVNNQLLQDPLCHASPCPLCSLYAYVVYACLPQKEVTCSVMTSRRPWIRPEHFSASSSFSRYSAGGCSGENTCSALGSCSDGSPRHQTATSSFAARFSSDALSAWCPSFCDRNNSFVQIDFGGQFEVSGYLLQGRRFLDHWVSAISISTSLDGKIWNDVAHKDLPASSDARHVTWCRLPTRPVARFLRLRVTDFSGLPCLHFDVATCEKRVTCPPLTIDHSNILLEPGSPGSALEVFCKAGRRTPSGDRSFSVSCGADGDWLESTLTDCSEAVDCGEIPHVVGALHDARNNKIAATVKYACLTPLQLVGDATITCDISGSWTLPPTCQ